MTDPIADMLTRIRNAYSAKLKIVTIPHSGIKLDLAKKLEELGYLTNVTTGDDEAIKNAKIISAGLVYKNKLPVMSNIKRISKPGRRVYTKLNHHERVLSGYGATILTTSKGILTGLEAKKQGVGGEVLCRIW